MIVVFLALGTTDLLFALDSIPAIFGLTREPFIVFTANVFALMGLRQLYFLLGGLLKRLVYLSLGLVGHPRVHRRQARARGRAREQPAVHQRRGAGARRPVHPDLAVADGDPRRARRRHGGQPDQDPGRAARGGAAGDRECPSGGSASVGGHAADRPRAPAHPRRPGRLPGRADGRGRGQPARPGRRRVPQPALGGADRRVGVRPAADVRAPGQRAGVLAGRPVAGLPQRRARRQAAALAAADRRGRAAPADRPPPRRRCAGVVAGLAAAGLRGAGAGAGPVRDGRGRRPGRRAAAADHDAEVPPGRRRLPRPTGPARSSCSTCPADFDDDTAAAARAGPGDHRPADCVDVTWRPDGAELAFVSARHPRADVDLVRDVYAIRPDGSGLRRVTGSRGDCALPAYGPAGSAATSPPSPTSGRTGVDFVARQAVPCRVGRAAAAANRCWTRGCTTAATRRRDGRGGRRRAGRASSARARWNCCACRWTAVRRRPWSTGRSPCAGSRPAAESSSPSSRTTGRPAS